MAAGAAPGRAAPLAAVRLPAPLVLPASGGGGGGGPVPATPDGAAALQAHLRAAHRIEVPVVCAGGGLYCRVSAQAYNALPQYARLGDAVAALRPRGGGGGG